MTCLLKRLVLAQALAAVVFCPRGFSTCFKSAAEAEAYCDKACAAQDPRYRNICREMCRVSEDDCECPEEGASSPDQEWKPCNKNEICGKSVEAAEIQPGQEGYFPTREAPSAQGGPPRVALGEPASGNFKAACLEAIGPCIDERQGSHLVDQQLGDAGKGKRPKEKPGPESRCHPDNLGPRIEKGAEEFTASLPETGNKDALEARKALFVELAFAALKQCCPDCELCDMCPHVSELTRRRELAAQKGDEASPVFGTYAGEKVPLAREGGKVVDAPPDRYALEYWAQNAGKAPEARSGLAPAEQARLHHAKNQIFGSHDGKLFPMELDPEGRESLPSRERYPGILQGMKSLGLDTAGLIGEEEFSRDYGSIASAQAKGLGLRYSKVGGSVVPLVAEGGAPAGRGPLRWPSPEELETPQIRSALRGLGLPGMDSNEYRSFDALMNAKFIEHGGRWAPLDKGGGLYSSQEYGAELKRLGAFPWAKGLNLLSTDAYERDKALLGSKLGGALAGGAAFPPGELRDSLAGLKRAFSPLEAAQALSLVRPELDAKGLKESHRQCARSLARMGSNAASALEAARDYYRPECAVFSAETMDPESAAAHLLQAGRREERAAQSPAPEPSAVSGLSQVLPRAERPLVARLAAHGTGPEQARRLLEEAGSIVEKAWASGGGPEDLEALRSVARDRRQEAMVSELAARYLGNPKKGLELLKAAAMGVPRGIARFSASEVKDWPGLAARMAEAGSDPEPARKLVVGAQEPGRALEAQVVHKAMSLCLQENHAKREGEGRLVSECASKLAARVEARQGPSDFEGRVKGISDAALAAHLRADPGATPRSLAEQNLLCAQALDGGERPLGAGGQPLLAEAALPPLEPLALADFSERFWLTMEKIGFEYLWSDPRLRQKSLETYQRELGLLPMEELEICQGPCRYLHKALALAPRELDSLLHQAIPVCLEACKGELGGGEGEKRKRALDRLSAEIIGAVLVVEPREYGALLKAIKARIKDLGPEEKTELLKKVLGKWPGITRSKAQQRMLDSL